MRLTLKKGHDAAVIHGHPWVFSGAIARVDGSPEAGREVEVCSSNGQWRGYGLMHPSATLAMRIYSWDPARHLDEAFFLSRIDQAIRLREELFRNRGDTNAYRVVFAESDGLSGLVIDRYADALSVQVDAKALLPWLGAMLRRAAERLGVTRYVVRAESGAEKREGLSDEDLKNFNRGELGAVSIRENGFSFEAEVGGGQKTGFYLDQRENRRRVASYAAGRRVLSAYCYTGAFEIHAAAGGATAIAGVDSSERALELARRHHQMNGMTVPAEYLRGDVPTVLRRFRDERCQFDLIVLDPPRFVANRGQKEKGLNAYKDINLLAMKLLAPGGVLATFSCSGLVTLADFRKMIGWASADCGRSVRILDTLCQPPDHPVLAVFPESEYLKGLICWVE